MEDKAFELLTKMYSEMTDKFSEISEQFKEISRKLDEKADKSDMARIENELNPKINALFYEHKKHTDILERIEKKLQGRME